MYKSMVLADLLRRAPAKWSQAIFILHLYYCCSGYHPVSLHRHDIVIDISLSVYSARSLCTSSVLVNVCVYSKECPCTTLERGRAPKSRAIPSPLSKN